MEPKISIDIHYHLKEVIRETSLLEMFSENSFTLDNEHVHPGSQGCGERLSIQRFDIREQTPKILYLANEPKLTVYQILSHIKGDLSATLSPPFLLAPKSMTELPICWIEHPSLFAAPALEPDPVKRALLVLKWFVVSLRSLLYTGEGSKLGMKKPLNPFLGELCIGSCTDEGATARLVVEQVRYVGALDPTSPGAGF